MLNRILRIAGLSLMLMTGALCADAQMSDSKVIEYVKKQMAAGKSQEQIGRELLAKGVPEAQIRRLINKYKNGELDESGNQTGNTTGNSTSDRTNKRTRGNQQRTSNDVANSNTNRNTQKQGQRQNGTSTNGKRQNGSSNSANNRLDNQDNNIAYYYDDQGNLIEVELFDEYGNPITPDYYQQEDVVEIFGHNVFSNQNLTFEPNPNLATPKYYRLGPGDEVFIDIWGESEDHINATISPEGSIIISQIGPVYLNGMTIDQANNYLRQLFASKYAGMTDEETQVNVTLGDIRSVTVNVMGEVEIPGTLTLSPFSSVFTALYQAGGINDLGSIRNIQVIRDGQKIATVDLYDYLFHGRQSNDLRLQEGDVIIVPSNTGLVTIEGNVKRPMKYEMLPTEPISKLLEYAGGFAGNAYSDMLTIDRADGLDSKVINIPRNQYDVFRLKDGDIVTVGQVTDRYQNRIELVGQVMRPGSYALDENINTLRNLILKTEGVLDDAFTDRVLIYRQGDDLSLEIIPANLTQILAGTEADIALRRNDMIVVSSISDIFDHGTVEITGPVENPGVYEYADNMSIEDLILMSGGLKQGASLARADVARRMVNPYATHPNDTISQIFSFSIKDGLVVDGVQDFHLMPYDIVQVRNSPGYSPQELVTVKGQVVFAGDYALQNRNERLSDLIKRTGGVTPAAYLKGASLIRKMTEDEILARDQTLRMAKNSAEGEDSISVNQLILSNTYAVGINLEEALKNPGSTYDIVIKDGDVLNVPEFQSTVKISGEVMYPTVTTYVPGKKAKYYVEKAGGYGDRARKNNAYIVYMNGQVEKINRKTVVEPGSQIIIPTKPQKKGLEMAQILSMTSAISTMGTMAATIYSIFKK